MLTILIPSHSRPHYLRRCIDYYRQLPFQVLIVDSSTLPLSADLPQHFRYLHLPAMPFADKVLTAAGQIDTPFVALCPDDDFLLPSQLLVAVEQMQHNPALSISFGRPVRFDESFTGAFRWAGAALPFPRLTGNKKIDIQRVMKRYEQMLWSVYRSDVLFESFIRIRQAHYQNDNFIELTIAAVAVALGTINPVTGIWMARETAIGEHWGKQHQPIGWQHQQDIEQYQQQLVGLLSVEESELALRAYINRLSPAGLIQRYRRYRRFLLRHQQAVAAPQVHGDLLRVQQVLTASMAAEIQPCDVN